MIVARGDRSEFMEIFIRFVMLLSLALICISVCDVICLLRRCESWVMDLGGDTVGKTPVHLREVERLMARRIADRSFFLIAFILTLCTYKSVYTYS